MRSNQWRGSTHYSVESVKDIEPKFIKHPGRWLTGRRWEDEPTGGQSHNQR